MLDEKLTIKPYIIGFVLGVINCYMCYSLIQTKIDSENLSQFNQINSDVANIKIELYKLNNK